MVAKVNTPCYHVLVTSDYKGVFFMKLNPDCVRDTLCSLELMLGINISTRISDPKFSFLYATPHGVTERLAASKTVYSEEDVLSTLIQLSLSGFIVSDFFHNARGQIALERILFISPRGHDLLASIHDDETWKKKIRPVLRKLSSISLSAIETVATSVITSALLG